MPLRWCTASNRQPRNHNTYIISRLCCYESFLRQHIHRYAGQNHQVHRGTRHHTVSKRPDRIELSAQRIAGCSLVIRGQHFVGCFGGTRYKNPNLHGVTRGHCKKPQKRRRFEQQLLKKFHTFNLTVGKHKAE
jgi:hypothetical protein